MTRTALVNVNVFDGYRYLEDQVVVIEDGTLGSDATGATEIDGRGGTVLPGLIDTHVHLHAVDNLRQALRFGVTTVLDMFSYPPSLTAQLRAAAKRRDDVADLLSCGILASAPGGHPARTLAIPDLPTLSRPEEAAAFVAARVAEGTDHLKIIVEDPDAVRRPALNADTVAALVVAAHAAGLRVVAHTAGQFATGLAVDAGVDILTHIPTDRPLQDTLVERIRERGQVSMPTLTMMQAVTLGHSGPDMARDDRLLSRLPDEVRQGFLDQTSGGLPPRPPSGAYDNARAGVGALIAAGLPVIAGTDANDLPGSAAAVVQGASLHLELAMLVDAGLSAVQALQAATSGAAKAFGLTDRGVIAPGLRADLLLVHGNPTRDISSTRAMRQVWRGGVPART